MSSSSMPLRHLRPGDRVNADGVSFVFQEDVPSLMASTSSTGDGFRWRWLMMGQILEERANGAVRGDGGLLIGDDGRQVHAIGLPIDGDLYPYASAPLSEITVVPHVSRGMFGRRIKGVNMQIGPSLAAVAFAVNELAGEAAYARRKREAAFCEHFGVPTL